MELYPIGTLGSTIFCAIKNIPSINPKKALIVPINVAIRRGLTEKAVKPFIHKPSNFEKVYPDCPTSLLLCLTSTLAIFWWYEIQAQKYRDMLHRI